MRTLLGLLLLIITPPVWAAIDFTDVDDSLTLPVESAFGVEGGPLTMGCWVDIDDAGDANETRMIGHVAATGEAFIHLHNSGSQVNNVFFFKDYSSTNLVRRTSDSTLTNPGLNHIVATWDGGATATNVHIYINGTEPSYKQTINGTGAEQSDNTKRWIIGDAQTSGGLRPMDGRAFECAVWGSELSAAQVAHWYHAKTRHVPLQLDPSNLVAYYPLDDGPDGTSADGDTIVDRAYSAGNATGDDGANNAGLTWTADTLLSYP